MLDALGYFQGFTHNGMHAVLWCGANAAAAVLCCIVLCCAVLGLKMGTALIEYLQAAKEAGTMPDVLVTDGLTSVRPCPTPPMLTFTSCQSTL
jgi:hypothetical protein